MKNKKMKPPLMVTLLYRKGDTPPPPLEFVDAECINKCNRCKVTTYMVYFMFGDTPVYCQAEDNGKLGRKKIEWFNN